ncbi:hypothetical protein NQT69_11735 [Pseudoalteromonas shioyasakiensis]|uniref:hypothetical protein n=1 Tax=Pseudoalteromonas shioyasakiensis TaxID=1190813 RepID=UPI002117627B|nr:hypothetical protein [Pseudoalteromonas shioyasakiensis]MCQ8878674.1 hypothetical protein [Pseudoalteromonas shioyasakiensis]
MSGVFLTLGICFMAVGLLPLARWLKCKISKHHWRVCEVENITAVVSNRIATLELVQLQTMLVSFRFNGHLHSALIGHDEKLLARFKQGIVCTVLVDSDNPNIIYNNAQLWQSFTLIWLLAGLSLLIGSFSFS